MGKGRKRNKAAWRKEKERSARIGRWGSGGKEIRWRGGGEAGKKEKGEVGD